MLIVERQKKLLELLQHRGAAELEELALQFQVSGSTVRRDLEALEQQGLVQRTHGGAVYQGAEGNGAGSQMATALTLRMSERVEQKRAIGRFASDIVQPNMTLLLDGGSTVVYAAELITARPLQVVTNSLAVANIFADDEQVELLIIGGGLYPRSGVLVGPIATGCMADLHADLLLFSLAGLYESAGFNSNLAMAQVEQVMLRQAARSMLLMDSSKFGRKSLVRVCSFDEVDHIVTDTAVDIRWHEELGGRLIVVNDSGQPQTMPTRDQGA